MTLQTHQGSRTMTDMRPPWQLTTSELVHEIEKLEKFIAEFPSNSATCRAEREQLGELYAQRDERKSLTSRVMRSAAKQFPDDAS